MSRILITILSLAVSSVAAAVTCQATSGPQRVALLELYTSEGCSSCPPADRWLSGLAAQGFGPDRVVPLAFHVDYWDYIGWTDRFARSAFSARQREQVRSQGGRVVYTPQVMVNGRDYSAWRSGDLSRHVSDIARQSAGTVISLALNADTPNRMEITAQARGEGVLYVAIYQNDLNSTVRAGENRGAQLHHDYVVREWYGPLSVGEPWNQSVAFKIDWVPANMGVAAFVQHRSSGEVLQALQLRFCTGKG